MSVSLCVRCMICGMTRSPFFFHLLAGTRYPTSSRGKNLSLSMVRICISSCVVALHVSHSQCVVVEVFPPRTGRVRRAHDTNES